MTRILFGIVLITALLAGLFCVSTHKEDIQADIARRVTHAVRGDDFNDPLSRTVGIHVNGRDVALSGYVPTQQIKEDIAGRVHNVFGVRKIVNNVQLTPPEPAPITPEITVSPPSAEENFEITENLPADLLDNIADTNISKEPAQTDAPPFLPEAEETEITEQQATPKSPVHIYEPGQPDLSAQYITCQNNIDALLSESPIRFTAGTATFKTQSYTVLDKIAQNLKTCPDTLVLIEGHTDNTTLPGRSVLLSKERAGAVVRYLSKQDVKQILKYTGQGSTRPIADNTTAKGRARNNRILFKIQPAQRRN
jgi:outer membrane protein OmpA-like peptidoglycan-associated protein